MNLITLYITAMIFGLSNGLSPGPALTLVISHTIQHNLKEGIKVASGPIVFGLVVVPITIFVSVKLNHYKNVIGWISIIGAIYIAYLGIKTIFSQKIKLNSVNVKPKSFWVGALANFSSPYAYLFWFTVGAPLIIRTEGSNIIAAICFVGIYYIFLIGSKIGVALIVEKFRFFIDKGYKYVMQILGIILLLFAYLTLKDGISFLLYNIASANYNAQSLLRS